MKKIIILISVYAVVYLGAMFFVQEVYHYDWTPGKTLKALMAKAAQEASLPEPEEEIIPVEPEPEPVVEAPKPKPKVVRRKPKTLAQQLAAKGLVDVQTLPVQLFFDLRYATTDNFTGTQLYDQAKCYLKEPVAKALEQAAKYALAADEPFYLCIYDCYRPASVQKIMLENAQEEGFLSKVSNHSRGFAVDLGPCDAEGQALLTPTEFDTFSAFSAAYTYADEIPQLAIKNRTALQTVMKKAGFRPISTEWWHFDYPGAKGQEVIDIKF